MYYYNNGETYWLSDEEQKLSNELNKEYQIKPALFDKVEEYVNDLLKSKLLHSHTLYGTL